MFLQTNTKHRQVACLLVIAIFLASCHTVDIYLEQIGKDVLNQSQQVHIHATKTSQEDEYVHSIKLKEGRKAKKKREEQEKEECLTNLHCQLRSRQQINCRKFDLRDVDLAGLDLRGADFSEANLKGANFTRSKLQECKFINAQLQKAKLCYADLTEADLTEANVNGAKFKGAHLYNIKCSNMRSAKGTLLVDKEQLNKKLEYEKEIDVMRSQFLTHDQHHLIVLEDLFNIKAIHHYLYTKLAELSKNKRKYIILDFRCLFLSTYNSTSPSYNYLFQECTGFLQTLVFKPFVRNVTPICDNQGLIIFLNSVLNNDANRFQILFFNTEGRSARNRLQDQVRNQKSLKKLDLHGKIPLQLICQRIDKFIKTSCKQKCKAVEIITGRGLHNTQGKMGVLWHKCETYLLGEKLRFCIQEIHSINKNGGWMVILRKNSRVRLKKQQRGFLN